MVLPVNSKSDEVKILKLPASPEFNKVTLHVYSEIGFIDIRQTEPKLNASGKWDINLIISKPDKEAGRIF